MRSFSMQRGIKAVNDFRLAITGDKVAIHKAVREEALALWREWFERDGWPFIAGEMGGDLSCFFCGERFFGDSEGHRPGCVFVRAAKLIEKADSL